MTCVLKRPSILDLVRWSIGTRINAAPGWINAEAYDQFSNTMASYVLKKQCAFVFRATTIATCHRKPLLNRLAMVRGGTALGFEPLKLCFRVS